MKFYNFDNILQTGVPEIDIYIGGLKKNNINIIIGEAKSGKSRLAQKIAVRVGFAKNVAYINREDTTETIHKNMSADLRNVSLFATNVEIIQPDFSMKELPVEKILDKYSPQLLIVDDNQFSEQILKNVSSVKDRNVTLLLVLQRSPNDTDEELQKKFSDYPVIVL